MRIYVEDNGDSRNLRIIRGSLRNLLSGDSGASLPHFVELFTTDLFISHPYMGDYWDSMSIGDSLVMYGEEKYLFKTANGGADLAVIKRVKTADNFHVIAIALWNTSNRSLVNYVDDLAVPVDYSFGQVLSAIANVRMIQYVGEDESMIAYNDKGERYFVESDSNHTKSNVKLVDVSSTALVNPTTDNQEETKMTKIANVVDKNKNALVTAAKIEAGSIALKQVSKIVVPKLPIMVRGYADTPAGRLLLANLFNFAVNQYAPRNEKAVLVADAMLQGAMVELVQSFDLNSLIEDVIGKVDFAKLGNDE
jgi:hypothetical protein